MNILVTGGTGFVMANFLRHWLEVRVTDRALCVDAAKLDRPAQKFFARVRDRVQFIEASVSSAETWANLPSDIQFVVHGAAVTPHSFVDASGHKHEPEREDPVAVVETNVVGTTRALEWAQRLPDLRRFVNVSTGSVYPETLAAQRRQPFALPEDGYIDPRGLYDISKYSSELISRRLGELYGFSAVSIRLSNVFGPMDRQTPFRNVRNPVNIIAQAAVAGHQVTIANPEVPGDYIYAPDVAEAIRLLLEAPPTALAADVYNIAYGSTVLVRELLDYARQSAPTLAFSVASAATADVTVDMDRSTGRWGAYDVSRAKHDFGWMPRPIAAALADYIDWLREDENIDARRRHDDGDARIR
jgi:UDP-glucose 4-epimerase